MLSSRVKVPVPDAGVIVRRTGRNRYVYKVTRTFRNDRGQPTNTRESIGRVDEASGMLVPNDAYWRHYPDRRLEWLPAEDSIRSVGAGFLAGAVMDGLGLGGALAGALGGSRAARAATVACYMACRGNVMDHLESWCSDHAWAGAPVDAWQASELFASISWADKMAFFRAWAAARPKGSYLAYDVTSVSSYAEGVEDTEWGHNRDGEKLPQINLGCYVNQDDALPVFYLTYPGSITDVSHLPHMMAFNDDLGVTDVGFVMDRGFCSTRNVQWMHARHLDVVLGVDIRHKTVRAAVDQARGGMVSMRNLTGHGVYARTVKGRFYGVECSAHVYHDPVRAERQRQDLFRVVGSWEERLAGRRAISEADAKKARAWFTIERRADGGFAFGRDYDKIDKAAQNNGYFVILTTADISADAALGIYRRKDMIEKTFDDVKNHLDMRRLRTHTTATTDGKLFCAFIALIVVSRVQTVLGPLMREKSWSKPAVIRELDKIRVVTTADGSRLVNPLTKTQRTILEAFNLTQEDITNYIKSHDPYMPKPSKI